MRWEFGFWKVFFIENLENVANFSLSVHGKVMTFRKLGCNNACNFCNSLEMGLFGAANEWGWGKEAECIPHIIQRRNLAQLSLTKKDPKNIQIKWYTTWVLLASAFLQRKSATCVISRNTGLYCILMHKF